DLEGAHAALADPVEVTHRIAHPLHTRPVLPRVAEGLGSRLPPSLPAEAGHQGPVQAGLGHLDEGTELVLGGYGRLVGHRLSINESHEGSSGATSSGSTAV